jgi:zinc protease
MLESVAGLLGDGLSEDEVEGARNRARRTLVQQLNGVGERADAFAHAAVLRGEPGYVNDAFARYREVSLQGCAGLASEIFDADRLVALRGGRVSTAGALDRTRPPLSEELRPLELPLFHRFRLDNGLRLLVAENPKLPEVSLRLILEAGAAAEQPELGGVAELTGRLLSEGAAGRSALEMAAWLDRLGAAFGASVGYDVSSLSMHFLSDVSDGALDYLRAVVREPAFEEEEVTRVRQERLDEIERHLDEPAVLADLRLIRTIYGDHPYGRPAGGEPETVASLGAAGVTEVDRVRRAGCPGVQGRGGAPVRRLDRRRRPW